MEWLAGTKNLGAALFPLAQARTAIVDLGVRGGLRLDYASLETRIDAARRLLDERFAGLAERSIGLMMPNGAAFFAAYFAVLRAGGVAVPLNYRLPAPTLATIARRASLAGLVMDPSFRSLAPADVPQVDATDVLDAPSIDVRLDAVLPPTGAWAKVLFTSGSTGVPKGVPSTHQGLLWALRRYVAAAAVDGATTIIVAPTYHKNGLFLGSVALASGERVVLMPRFDAAEYLDAILHFSGTRLSGVPSMLALATREAERRALAPIETVRHILIGSAPLTGALLHDVRRLFPLAEITNGYGITEAGPAIFGAHPEGLPRPSVSVGYPLPEVRCRLEGGDGTFGELLVWTPALTPGYLNDAALWSTRFRDGWYRTGDVMRRDAAGFFHFVGRTDDMFVCGGENVYPSEIEQVLESHPGVAHAVIVPGPDDVKGAIPIAFVVRKATGEPVDEASLREFCLRHAAPYLHPRAIEFVRQIPLGSTNKVDRTVLLEQARRISIERGRSRADRN